MSVVGLPVVRSMVGDGGGCDGTGSDATGSDAPRALGFRAKRGSPEGFELRSCGSTNPLGAVGFNGKAGGPGERQRLVSGDKPTWMWNRLAIGPVEESMLARRAIGGSSHDRRGPTGVILLVGAVRRHGSERTFVWGNAIEGGSRGVRVQDANDTQIVGNVIRGSDPAIEITGDSAGYVVSGNDLDGAGIVHPGTGTVD